VGLLLLELLRKARHKPGFFAWGGVWVIDELEIRDLIFR
jgi:hypothetical protein